MELINVLPLITIVLTIFFAVNLFALKKGNLKANIFLSILLVFISISTTTPSIIFWDNVVAFLIFLLGPLLLLYIKLITDTGYHLSYKELLHLIPFGISIIALLFFPLILDTLFIIKNIHIAIYCIYTLLYISRYKRRLKYSFSNLEKMNLTWIKVLISAFIIYFLGLVPIFSIFLLLELSVIKSIDLFITPALILFYIFILGISGIRFNRIFIYNKDSAVKDVDYRRVIEFIEREKPYLDSELSLQQLAEMVEIPDYYLSRIINEIERKNFCDLINNYRVNYFNLLLGLEENKKRKILDLAFESGFYSKSAFNSCYKKIMDETPSQYRKRIKKG